MTTTAPIASSPLNPSAGFQTLQLALTQAGIKSTNTATGETIYHVAGQPYPAAAPGADAFFQYPRPAEIDALKHSNDAAFWREYDFKTATPPYNDSPEDVMARKIWEAARNGARPSDAGGKVFITPSLGLPQGPGPHSFIPPYVMEIFEMLAASPTGQLARGWLKNALAKAR